MRIRDIVATSAAFMAVLTLASIGSAGAGLNDLQSNTFTVEKDVAGPVPESAVFEV